MTWVQTYGGRAFDLLQPDWRDVDFHHDVPIALSRINRFNGHTAYPYSVAQHCVLGADLFARQGRSDLAAYFLLHDAHEAFCGDIASPVAAALLPAMIGDEIAALKQRLDIAIWRAAFVPWPLPETAAAVADMDLRMLRAERDQLKCAPPKRWGETIERAEPAPVVIERWGPTYAEGVWRDRFRRIVVPIQRPFSGGSP